ncbi:MAG: nuclear transport factor 2 family protein [Actinomycetota bacterium]|nr:nuclear transport factor 2 family protein [Actinomycetota bacterium]
MTNNDTSTIPDAVDTTVIDTYLDTWNETDAAKRAALIDASLGEDIWYRDPMLEADGRQAYDDMITAVQSQFPGLVMRRTSGVDGHHDLVRFNWSLGEPGTAPVFSGVDVGKFDDDGKLHRIIGFVPETATAA